MISDISGNSVRKKSVEEIKESVSVDVSDVSGNKVRKTEGIHGSVSC